MKNNALIRMILYSVALIVLLAIFIAGMTGDLLGDLNLSFGGFSVHLGDDPNTPGTASSNGQVSAEETESIHVQWAVGSVTIQTGDVEEIQFSETGNFDEENAMFWNQGGNTLRIQYCKPKVIFGISYNGSAKDLTITVPRDWSGRRIQIEAASAYVEILNLTVGTLEFDGASGTLSLENCAVGNLDVDTASGDVYFNGTLKTLDCDAASANLVVVLSNVPDSIELDSASGDLDLTLPAGSGFELEMDTMSGDFSSDFPTTNKNGSHVCGDRHCKIEVDGMSSDVIIRQAQ